MDHVLGKIQLLLRPLSCQILEEFAVKSCFNRMVWPPKMTTRGFVFEAAPEPPSFEETRSSSKSSWKTSVSKKGRRDNHATFMILHGSISNQLKVNVSWNTANFFLKFLVRMHNDIHVLRHTEAQGFLALRAPTELWACGFVLFTSFNLSNHRALKGCNGPKIALRRR